MFDRLQGEVERGPLAFDGDRSLAAWSGSGEAAIRDLILRHAHLTPAEWLERTRVRVAARRLAEGALPSQDLAQGLGFASDEAFRRSFRRWQRIDPSHYGRLDAEGGFSLVLPPGFRPDEVLGYHGRDPASQTERREGPRLWKAIDTVAGPVILEIGLLARSARARIHADDRPLPAGTIAALQDIAVAMLGIDDEVGAFETAHPAIVGARRGLRVARLPTAFEALAWAIIGQQINLRFAAALRREVIELAGARIGSMLAHPTPEAVAQLSVEALTRRRFSRSKASYLIDAAQAIAAGRLPLATLVLGSAEHAAQALVACRGIGTWTARYVLLRTGYRDVAPVGDSALATALEHSLGLSARPDRNAAEQAMAAYAPHRSLATVHLWASLH